MAYAASNTVRQKARIPNSLKLHWVRFYLSSVGSPGHLTSQGTVRRTPVHSRLALETSAQGMLIGKMHAMHRWHAPFCASLLRTLLLQHQNRLLPSAVAAL